MAKINWKDGDYVKFTRKDCSDGVRFNEGDIHKVHKADIGMSLIGHVWVWNSSLTKSSKEEHDEHVEQHGLKIVKSDKKSDVEYIEGKKLKQAMKTGNYVLYSVDNGKYPKSITEAKKLLEIKRGEEFSVKFFKNDKYSFAIKNISKTS